MLFKKDTNADSYFAEAKRIIVSMLKEKEYSDKKRYEYYLCMPEIPDIKRKKELMERNVDIIVGLNGEKIVLINDIRFKGKKREDWKEVENYLKEYVGEFYEIAETSEKIFMEKANKLSNRFHKVYTEN